MILVVDMNSEKNSFGFSEFVLPIVAIAEEKEKCVVKHYLEVNEKNLNGYDKIILSGNALKNTVTLNQTARFTWIKNCSKPILGICAGMQTTCLVFGSARASYLTPNAAGSTALMSTNQGLIKIVQCYFEETWKKAAKYKPENTK